MISRCKHGLIKEQCGHCQREMRRAHLKKDINAKAKTLSTKIKEIED